MHRLLLLFFLFSVTLLHAQFKVKIIDADTNMPLAFATIVFDDGKAGYSDKEGVFLFTKKEKFSVTMLGYKPRLILEDDFADTIALVPEAYVLDSIVVSSNAQKKKSIKKKAVSEKSDFFNSYNPFIGHEISVLLNTNGKKGSLEKIAIPIVQRPYRKIQGVEAMVAESAYTTIRLRFYSNTDGIPGNIAYPEDIVLNIPNNDYEVFDIDLSAYTITLPENGLFIGIEFLGNTDSNQQYIYTPNYVLHKNDNGTDTKIAIPLAICISFTDKQKLGKTYIRDSDWNNNGSKSSWQTFENFFMIRPYKKEDKTPDINIGIGYEITVYDE